MASKTAKQMSGTVSDLGDGQAAYTISLWEAGVRSRAYVTLAGRRAGYIDLATSEQVSEGGSWKPLFMVVEQVGLKAILGFFGK